MPTEADSYTEPFPSLLSHGPPRAGRAAGLPGWAGVMNSWGGKMLAAIESVAELAAQGLGLPRAAFVERMQLGPHLLAPTGARPLANHRAAQPITGFRGSSRGACIDKRCWNERPMHGCRIHDPMSCSECQTGPTVSYWFRCGGTHTPRGWRAIRGLSMSSLWTGGRSDGRTQATGGYHVPAPLTCDALCAVADAEPHFTHFAPGVGGGARAVQGFRVLGFNPKPNGK
jgi:hypothetical protein